MHDLVHIGFQKSASSLLQEQIFPRSALRTYLRPVRALRELISVEDEGRAVSRLRGLIEAADGPVLLSHEALCGDVLGGSEHRERTADRLGRVLREPRVLVLVRAQPTMLVSLYGQYLNQGGTAPFRGFLSSDAHGVRFDPAHLEYDWLLERYAERFGPDRVVVLPFEQLGREPVEFARSLEAFLGEPVTTDHERLVNPSGSAWAMDLQRRANRAFRRSTHNPSPLVPIRGAHRMRGVAQRIHRGRTMWQRHGEEATRFAARYADANARLRDLVPWNPEHYGYPL